jgi:hypothetical protein
MGGYLMFVDVTDVVMPAWTAISRKLADGIASSFAMSGQRKEMPRLAYELGYTPSRIKIWRTAIASGRLSLSA